MGWLAKMRGRQGDGPARGSEAELRKARSIEVLTSQGVPVLDSLPSIETVDESVRRSTEEVALRALALATVAVKGEAHGEEGPEGVRAFVDDLVEGFNLQSAFTPAERAFVDNDGPSERDRVQFTWRYESYWTMLWALGFIPELGTPSHLCDPAIAMGIMRDHGREGFLEAAELRAQDQILGEADLIYRYHWAVVSARLRGESVDGLDPGVVYERHCSLNWLIGYQEQEWDDISTDT